MRKFIFISIFVILIYASSTSFAQQTACDYKVEILVDGDEFESEEFKWRMRAVKVEGKSTNITGTAKIEDENGKTVKSYKPWTSDSISKQKTSSEYSPNLRAGEYKIIAEIDVECDDTNKDNNKASKEIKIKGEEDKRDEEEEQSEEIKQTDTFKKVNSEEPKQAINTITTKSAKSASSEEYDNIIRSNANNKKAQKPEITTTTIKKPEIVYESSNEKAQGLIMVFLLTLSILLNIILIWKR